MPRPTGKHDIAPKIRAALIRAASRQSKDGDAVSYMASQLEKCMEEDFLAVLNAVSKFTVKEKQIDKTVTTRTLADLIQHGISPETGQDSAVEAEPGSVRH